MSVPDHRSVHILETITIARAPEVVFGWIADPARARRWQPDVRAYEVTKETPDLVGTEFREWLGDRRRSIEMRGRVAECVPNERIAFEVHGGGVTVASQFDLGRAAAGTKLTVDLDFRLLGRLSFAIEPFIRGRIARQLRGELAALGRLCEADGPADRTPTGG